MARTFDIAVIGAGMAGVSAAAALAGAHKVCVLEMERQPGYHATGRSSATYVPAYGPPAFQALARASGPFLHDPPAGYCDTALLAPRGEVMMVLPGQETHLAEADRLGMKPLPLGDFRNRVPLVRDNVLAAAMIDDNVMDIDVDLMLQGYVRTLKRLGGEILTDTRVTGLSPRRNGWTLATANGDIEAGLIVNAAGAWASDIAAMAGAQPLRITPKRRSAMLLDLPAKAGIANWPLCFGAGETFYFKPMGGRLMLSPADATPVEPHDAWADDMKLAEAVERFQQVIDFEVTHAGPTWGGLRSFADDGNPVVGFDTRRPRFFWLAGQGGYGIQTAPALARLTAALVAGQPVPDDIAACGLSMEDVSPQRFT